MSELIPEDPDFPVGAVPTTLSLQACTKANIERIGQAVIHQVKEGYADPVEEFIKAKALTQLAEQIIKGTQESTINAMRGAKTYEHKGVHMTFKSGARKYDFSDNPDWAKLNEQLEETKAAMKVIEDLMKKAMDFTNVTDEFGVVIPPARVVGGSADSVSVAIPKK